MVQTGINVETILWHFLLARSQSLILGLFVLIIVSLTLELRGVLVSKRGFPIKAFGCSTAWAKTFSRSFSPSFCHVCNSTLNSSSRCFSRRPRLTVLHSRLALSDQEWQVHESIRNTRNNTDSQNRCAEKFENFLQGA